MLREALGDDATVASLPVRVAIVGATGSVGTTALDVASRYPHFIQVRGVVAHRNAQALVDAAERVGAHTAVLSDETQAATLRALARTHSSLPDLHIDTGSDAVRALVSRADVDVVLAAAMGIAGLQSVLAALEAGKRVALANKESLVAGGPLVRDALWGHGGSILPVDSEHAALFALLQRVPLSFVKNLVLTASGGPFRKRPLESLENVTVAEATTHPRWVMGAKISVDSATLMNKALELIEAVWLFGVPHKQVQVLIHPQSVVHGMLELHDGSVHMHASTADMSGPIAAALCFPHSPAQAVPPIKFARTEPLEFQEVDTVRFPAIQMARAALDAGGAACAVLNSANEAAVQAFLDGRLSFARIVPTVEWAISTLQYPLVTCVEDLTQIDLEVRRRVKERCS